MTKILNISEEAARAYDEVAKEYNKQNGNFIKLNFPEQSSH
jgi:hypothetical protein